MSTPHPDDCLDVERLEAVLAGAGDARQTRHVAECSECRSRLATLRANNELMQAIMEAARPATSGPQPDREASSTPTIEGYEVLSEIRRGGQGIVYKAEQRATRRTVAVKVLLESRLTQPARRQRFEREIEVAAALRHPSIVTVYDSGTTDDGRLYFAMEYVDGRPLDEFVEQRADPERTLPLPDALALFCAACDAVNHAHQHGVIHRDLKPGNILVDGEGRPHVVDFGLAKALGPEGGPGSLVTSAGQFMGTLAYAAPEQLRGAPDTVDVRTDVYALGVILYELLAGRPPYAAGATLSDAIRAITEVDPPPPSVTIAVVDAHRPLDSDLDTIVLKALAKDPHRRYQTAGALADDIRRYLRGEAIDARRDSSWYVLRKTLRRYRWPVGVAAGFALLLVAFSIAMTLMYRRAVLEAEKAQQIKVFLEDTLGSVEPERQGAEVSVRTVLDEAVHWVEIALRGQPEVEASLRTTIGNSYRSLGLYDRAEEQLTMALDIHRRLFGHEHTLVAQSLNALGALARDRGDHERALALFRQGLELRRRLLGEQHYDVSVSLQNVASAMSCQGDWATAAATLRESLGIRRRLFPGPHPDVAMAEFMLAETLRQVGSLAEAAQLHRSALATRQSLLHAEHPDVSRSLQALARTLMALHQPHDAEPLLREYLDRQTRAMPVNPSRLIEAQAELEACTALMRGGEEPGP